MKEKELKICKTLKSQNLSDEILEKMKEKEKEIKGIQNLGNLIRVKNNTLKNTQKGSKFTGKKNSIKAYQSSFLK